jgi:hypothetical protein
MGFETTKGRNNGDGEWEEEHGRELNAKRAPTFLVGAADIKSKSTRIAPADRNDARSFSAHPRDRVHRMKVSS